MFIWRVENDLGMGCYYSADETKDILERHTDPVTHPEPKDDRGIKRNLKLGEICGFLTEEQALNWFDKKELELLIALGYTLKKVKVSQIIAIGEKQVLARR